MICHQFWGTGGCCHKAGSEYSEVCVGTTIVPDEVITSIKAWITATGPPHTQPNDLSEECIISVMPASTPNALKSSARLKRVRGSGALSTASRSLISLTPLTKYLSQPLGLWHP